MNLTQLLCRGGCEAIGARAFVPVMASLLLSRLLRLLCGGEVPQEVHAALHPVGTDVVGKLMAGGDADA